MSIHSILFVVQFFLFTILYRIFYADRFKNLLQSTKFYTILFVSIIILQIICIGLIQKEIGDVKQFTWAGWTFRNGEDFYKIDTTHRQYPFLPTLIFFFALFNNLSLQIPYLTFSFYLKLFLLLPSLYGLGYLIYKWNSKVSVVVARQHCLQFVVSPITYSIVLFHGQTDVLLLFFFLLGSDVFLRGNTFQKTFIGSFLFGLSITIKTWSIIFLPLFMKYARSFQKILFLIMGIIGSIALCIVLYVSFVNNPNVGMFFQVISSAGGPIGIWGISLVASFFPNLLSLLLKYNLVFFGGIFLLFQGIIIMKKNVSFMQSVLLTVLSMYVLVPNWGVQYLFWIVPFLFLLKRDLDTIRITIFTLLTSLYVFLNYLNNSEENLVISSFWIHSIGFILWIFICYWFCYLLKNLKNTDVSQDFI